jgi:hypothetical protein
MGDTCEVVSIFLVPKLQLFLVPKLQLGNEFEEV